MFEINPLRIPGAKRVENVLSQYGAVERSGVRHVYGCTAPSSDARIVDGIDTRADVGLVIVLVDTLHRSSSNIM